MILQTSILEQEIKNIYHSTENFKHIVIDNTNFPGKLTPPPEKNVTL